MAQSSVGRGSWSEKGRTAAVLSKQRAPSCGAAAARGGNQRRYLVRAWGQAARRLRRAAAGRSRACCMPATQRTCDSQPALPRPPPLLTKYRVRVTLPIHCAAPRGVAGKSGMLAHALARALSGLTCRGQPSADGGWERAAAGGGHAAQLLACGSALACCPAAAQPRAHTCLNAVWKMDHQVSRNCCAMASTAAVVFSAAGSHMLQQIGYRAGAGVGGSAAAVQGRPATRLALAAQPRAWHAPPAAARPANAPDGGAQLQAPGDAALQELQPLEGGLGVKRAGFAACVPQRC